MSKQYEAIVALGCGVDMHGELTNDARSSVHIAAELLGQSATSLLIFSGGYNDKIAFVPPVSEARAMKHYAVELGVDPDDIEIEEKSRDTLGNAYFSKTEILAPLAIRSLAIVGSPDHSPERLQYIFNKVLGSEYDFDLVERGECQPARQAFEKKLLTVLQHWTEDIEDGDDAGIYGVMCERYPGYNADPRVREELNRQLKIAS